MALQQLNTTQLDFDEIKKNIKIYFLRQDSAYKDWNFEGSSLNLLLDVLAYNTHYNAVLAHMSINESFIDSAQIRKNVVSHAKLVGYTPRSANAARAEIELTDLTLKGRTQTSFTLSRNTQFTSVVNDVTYVFILLADYTTIALSGTNKFEFIKANSQALTICEGVMQISSYSVNNSLISQKFVIDEINVDISTLIVRVRNHVNSNEYTIFSIYGSEKYKTLEDLNSDSLVFFISENLYGRYEISFGNNIFGKLPGNLNIVELEYIVTSADAANYAREFKIVHDNVDSCQIKTLSSAAGGAEREGIESIRFNAPISIITQNRAVTAEDYRSLILREHADIQTLNVWGGEYSSPPEYGKVFIAIKPKLTEQLSEVSRARIEKTLLEKKVVTVTPVFVNVDFTYIYLDVYFKFNSNLTQYGRSELESIVRQTVNKFNVSELQEFDNVFRYSKLLKSIDNSNPAILNSFIQVYLYKKVYLYAGEPQSSVINFNSTAYIKAGKPSIISTDLFKVNGQEVRLSDEIIDNSLDVRNVYMHTDSGYRFPNSFGKFNNVTSTLSLEAIDTDEDAEIRVYIEPGSYDLFPTRNQLLTIDSDTSSFFASVDSIAVSGAAGVATYSTYNRN